MNVTDLIRALPLLEGIFPRVIIMDWSMAECCVGPRDVARKSRATSNYR